MKFSQRNKLTPVRDQIQQGAIDVPLKNQLWNYFLDLWNFYSGKHGSANTLNDFIVWIYRDCFEQPIDSIPKMSSTLENRVDLHTRLEMRAWFFNASYEEVYDFIEFITVVGPSTRQIIRKTDCNEILKKYLADVRFIEGQLTIITDQIEVETIEEALKSSGHEAVKDHLKQALQHLSNREDPDYRNSVKESISAVECQCRNMTGQQTLGAALKTLNGDEVIPPALFKGWTGLYGWSSGKGGIRHALMEEDKLDADLAKYFLISCASFINYLKTIPSSQ